MKKVSGTLKFEVRFNDIEIEDDREIETTDIIIGDWNGEMWFEEFEDIVEVTV